MVEELFRYRKPMSSDSVLDPGCGQGAFIEGVFRWCALHNASVPKILGVESDPELYEQARARFHRNPRVEIRAADFLCEVPGTFDFVIGNPPYVGITGLDEEEKERYRTRFQTATGRFDLYFLFFEQAIKSLRNGGRLVFITPEKFLYVDSGKSLRQLLARTGVRSVTLVDEKTFPGLITYPAITTVEAMEVGSLTQVTDRKGLTRRIRVPPEGGSWLPRILGQEDRASFTLDRVCTRISAGVATGADGIFVQPRATLPEDLIPYAYQTVAGRQISGRGIRDADRYTMLIPYSGDGALLPMDHLNGLGSFLRQPHARIRLAKRTCVSRRSNPKPWYAFHETPILAEILKPKILCKDISPEPIFVVDERGTIVPRHSAYYIVPRHPEMLGLILEYLNSPQSKRWLQANCQRAANGFLRLQSRVLKRLPIPENLDAILRELDDQTILRSPARRAAIGPKLGDPSCQPPLTA